MKRHNFDPVSFVFGAFFGGIGLLALFGEIDFTSFSDSWLLPAVLVVMGVLLLLPARSYLSGEPTGSQDTIETRSDRTEELDR